MDDFYAIVPPGTDYREILASMRGQASRCDFTFGESKTRYVPLTKAFRYCKTKYMLTETGKVVTRGNRDAERRNRKKITAFRKKLADGEMNLDALWASINSMMAYLDGYNEHKVVLRLRRQFFRLFGFSLERYNNFKEAD